jgi:hypothetical protein
LLGCSWSWLVQTSFGWETAREARGSNKENLWLLLLHWNFKEQFSALKVNSLSKGLSASETLKLHFLKK